MQQVPISLHLFFFFSQYRRNLKHPLVYFVCWGVGNIAPIFYWSQDPSSLLWLGVFTQNLFIGFILCLIYSFKQRQPHWETTVLKLRVELTSIIMQICKENAPIVAHSSEFLPPPVPNIPVNILEDTRRRRKTNPSLIRTCFKQLSGWSPRG